jgi:hypothetical protein
MKFHCVECDFHTDVKCNYDLHIERPKHKKLTEHKESNEHIILRQIREIRQLKLKLVQSQILIETNIDDHAEQLKEKDGVIKILMDRCNKYEFSL